MGVLTEGSAQQTVDAAQQAVAILVGEAQPNVDRFLAAQPMTPEQAQVLAAMELFLLKLPGQYCDSASTLEIDFALCHWCLKGNPPVLRCC